MLDVLPAAIYTTDAQGRITYYNEAAAALWGHRPELDSATWCGAWKLFWPDGRAMAHDECPMAVALRTGEAVRGAEAFAERPDGTRVHFTPYPTPLFDISGRLVGGVNMLVDITDRRRSEESALRLASIVDSSDDAIVGKDLRGIVTSWNAGAQRLFGYTADEMIGRSITILIPPERLDEEPGILGRIVRGERVDPYETVRRRKDGSLVDISLTVSPIRSHDGTVIGASKIARDITERRRAQEQANLLLSEMKHRLKNSLSVVQAIASQTLGSVTPEDHAAFAGRLQALAGAQDLLTLKNLRSVPLREVLARALAPFQERHAERIVLDGVNDIWLDAGKVTLLSMGLHELATNAAKYGALSNDTGTVHLTWRVMPAEETRRVKLVWREKGGPPVERPQRKGFGSLLLEQALKSELGRASLEFRPGGVVCSVELTI
ncbi:MAG: PAS domain S-box protein [Alphaproteobacteria bacterium]|nr:PAS domain S-box protein [Alphaproteobacteria bacterium]